jgi:hypothetical protein
MNENKKVKAEAKKAANRINVFLRKRWGLCSAKNSTQALD